MQLGVKIAIILFSFVLLFGCKKKDPTPVAPTITFSEAFLSATNDYSIVRFEFYDGDGDLGLTQDENTGEYEYNLFVDYYEKINGVWVLKSPLVRYDNDEQKYDTTYLDTRIPFIENESKDALEGEMEVDLIMHPLLYNNNGSPDTIKYELVLKDRALHYSNKISTTELIVY